MVDIPTPIPESFIESLRAVWAGSLGDTLWKLAISVLIITLAVALLFNFGVIGGFVGAILLSALLEDDIRDAVVDVWNRDFAEIEL